MRILILDTEQTYGDIGYVIYENGVRLVERQLVAEDVLRGAKQNAGLKQKMEAYEKLPASIYTKAPLNECLTILAQDIKKYNALYLITHNLAADRKVFNSWCLSRTDLNPFSLLKAFDSQELVKFLTMNASSYSLESFVREFSDEDFVQEHTGLADARLITEIFEALTDTEIEFFLADTFDLFKEYAKGNNSIQTLLHRECSKSQIAKTLHGLGFANEIRYSLKTGAALAQPTYQLNQKGHRFFDECKKFLYKKPDMRNRYQRKVVMANITKQEPIPTAPETKSLAESVNDYRRKISALSAVLQGMENERKTIIENANREFKKITDMANNEATQLLDNAKTESANTIDKANKEAEQTIKDAKEKSTKIMWTSWADRIFWPILGVALGVVSFILMNLTF